MDKKLQALITQEQQRQESTLGLIASENVPSQAVRDAVGSVFMHKYSEGYPEARYYEGNSVIDDLEATTRTELLKLFELSEHEWHANVQVLSGSVANLAVYNALLEPGDTILSMYLTDGGHLSHGWSYDAERHKAKSPAFAKATSGKKENDEVTLKYEGGERKVSIISKFYNVVQYKTDPNTQLFNYDEIERIAKEVRPKFIITGGTAYPRNIDYARMRAIADEVGAYYHADVAHEAGLIAGGAVPAPFEHADFVTFTTHKTFRGPKGAVAMCRKQFAKKLDRSVFPGIQGGPFNHSIAGILQATYENQTHEFKDYAQQIVTNAQVMAQELIKLGFTIVTGGTDKHLLLIDLRNTEMGGSDFAEKLAQAGMIANKNTVPWDTASPANPSGIRVGTPLVTTRGMKEAQMKEIAQLMKRVYDGEEVGVVWKDVKSLCARFPLYA